MKRLVIVLLGLMLLYSCGPVPESKATMSAPDGIIPFDNAVHFKYKNHQYIKFVEDLDSIRFPEQFMTQIVNIVRDE